MQYDNMTINKAYKMLFTNYPDVVTTADISRMLGVCIKKVYDLIHEGKIQTIPCGRCIKVAKVEIICYVLGKKSA